MAKIMLSLTYSKQKKATKTYIPACQHLNYSKFTVYSLKKMQTFE